jgi:hypothetical protein
MTAEEARARAQQCEQIASTTDDPTVRSFNEYLAEQWHMIADQLEREGRAGEPKKSPGLEQPGQDGLPRSTKGRRA